ncbi:MULTISPECIES: TetR/AcrR family transcriptional regulator [Bradyrhizobium]|jgi:AcrR family transcriptional regulator|uniref:TetR/AcrR family transcriptional regulator n=1 Tax=Bradyrhizobium TaxID=374 RepID=UPI0004B2A089|nr:MULTISPECIES: TetR/AcrR family transcriptional regulator [Bradyrhizobium]MBR0876291.1 TetR/AcrR family transcriptional regulator [Bradyrhizobium liaoningense]MBR0945427.1 TetR/AcrR family transcriptional regulator [Bradyrhizobium liaoningense]MBR1025756.1 TetR/AcrR family transcriptional regulator [Bradyrhizobium liaoningense]MBR1062897.1 TetR/AcrR family transcriptional regulator [Bradyrhizobium liaoningense]MCP1778641.1 AcrR family transcriptional regulator [Bradyrhizobium japonicum]
MGMGRPREFDAETALDQAMEVFWRHGYEGATIAQLTEAMGINPPSLYACFGNKEGLLKAALDRYTKLRGVWMDEVVAAPTARDVAERMLMGIADKQTDPSNPPGCLLVQGGIACGTGSENVPFELAARRSQNEDQLRDRFVRAKAEGDLKPTSDPAALARYVSAVSVGMGVMASSGADREALRQVASVAVQAIEAQSAQEQGASRIS